MLLTSISRRFHDVTKLPEVLNKHNADDITEKVNGDVTNYFGDIFVLLPSSWMNSQTTSECLHGRNFTQNRILFNKVQKHHPDFLLSSPHPIFGSEPWARQYGGCQEPGHGVMVPYTLLTQLDDDIFGTEDSKVAEKYARAGT